MSLERCPTCDREDCGRFVFMHHHGGFMPSQDQDDECDEHAVNWRERALASEKELEAADDAFEAAALVADEDQRASEETISHSNDGAMKWMEEGRAKGARKIAKRIRDLKKVKGSQPTQKQTVGSDDERARELAFHIIGDQTKSELSKAEKIAIDFATVAIKLAFADVRTEETEACAKVLETVAARFTIELPAEALYHVREVGEVLAEVYRRGAVAIRARSKP